MKPAHHHDAGFTLIELLVSLALLSLAAVLIAQSFSLDRKALWRLQDRTSAGEEVAAAQDLIRWRIEHLFPQATFDSNGAAGVDMDGVYDHLEFLAASPNAMTPIQRYRLALDAKGGLNLSLVGRDGNAPPSPGSSLLDGVKRLEISYYGSPDSAHPAAWVSAWNGAGGPPKLVRVRLSFSDGDRHIWPELIVRPAASVDTACVLDPDTGLCRGRS